MKVLAPISQNIDALTMGSGCGSVPQSGCFRYQRSAVRIQTLAIFYIQNMFTVEKTIKDKRNGESKESK